MYFALYRLRGDGVLFASLSFFSGMNYKSYLPEEDMKEMTTISKEKVPCILRWTWSILTPSS